MSLKVVSLKSLPAVSYSPSVVTMAVSVAVCDMFSVKEWPDLETGLGFVQGHWKWHQLTDRLEFKYLSCLHTHVPGICKHNIAL